VFDFGRPWTRNIDQLQREMERYLEHISRAKPRSVVFSQRAWQPAADVYETADVVIALVELPGVAEDEIELIVERESLILSGERKDLGSPGDRRYSHLEIPFGPFERRLQLPAPVSPDQTKATYRAGFLEIVMPKLTQSGPQRVGV
jgi:HSP20 family protein